MENRSNSAEDIKVIRRLMEESSRFLSLSGLSGILAGTIATIGALIAYFLILDNGNIRLDEYTGTMPSGEAFSVSFKLLADAAIVLVLSVLFAFWFSVRKAKRDGKDLWTPVSRKMLINLLIPLVTGGIFVIVLSAGNNIQLIIPCLLIFYGLALVNAGKFTIGEIFYLGIMEIFTGLLAAFVPGWGLIFWIFGFGLLHIVYGLAMYRKYEA